MQWPHQGDASVPDLLTTTDRVWIDALNSPLFESGIFEGGEVTPGSGLSVNIAESFGMANGAYFRQAATTNEALTADGSNPRLALVYRSVFGNGADEGTAHATRPHLPTVSGITTGSTLPLAVVYIAAGATSLASTDIFDLRPLIGQLGSRSTRARRAWEAYAAGTVGDTAFWGIPGHTSAGTPTDGSDSAGPLVIMTSGAVSGNTAGKNTQTAQHQRQWEPDGNAHFKTDASAANIGTSVGWSSASIAALTANPTTQHCAVFRYDTSIDTASVHWRIVHCDGGGTATVYALDGGGGRPTLAYTADTNYEFRIVMLSSQVRFYTGTTLLYTTTAVMPGSTTGVGFWTSVATRTGSAKTVRVRRVFGTQKA